MSKIYDLPISFILARRYIKFTFKRYYGEFIVIGKENIPNDCPVIFAPNHTNALMDAIAVHAGVSNKLPIVFLARADIFRDKKVAKFLNFAKIMPAFRMRDGVENLGKNSEIFDLCVEILDHNGALGIMPEANQEVERKLRPLAKGIFRIAFAAQQKHGTKPTVKIIPVGLNFGSLQKYGKHIIIIFGKPIEVSDYMNEYDANPVVTTNQFRDRLKNELSAISLDLATDNYYECFETALEVCNSRSLLQLKLPDTTVNRLIANQYTAQRLISLEKNSPDKVELLNKLCQDYSELLKKMNIKDWVLDKAPFNSFLTISESLLLLVTAPLFAGGFILNGLPFFLPVYLRKNVIKPEFTGFYSSLQFAIGIIAFPLFYLLQTLIFAGFTTSTWWENILFLLLQYPLGVFAIKWNNRCKKQIAKIRFYRFVKSEASPIFQAQKIRAQIVQLVNEQ
jgi:1-acyl-sn-glycerol-3-phosphate acyltransferase